MICNECNIIINEYLNCNCPSLYGPVIHSNNNFYYLSNSIGNISLYLILNYSKDNYYFNLMNRKIELIYKFNSFSPYIKQIEIVINNLVFL
jgi:hypothetical protein